MSFHDTHDAARFSPQKMTKTNLFESHRMFCDLYCLEPGQSQPPHAHEGSDKVYHVLSGECEVTVGEETRTLLAGQLAVAPAGEQHALLNASDARTTLLVLMAPHPNRRPGGHQPR